MANLCCILNPRRHCQACDGRWCTKCWSNGRGQHRYNESVSNRICPVTGQIIMTRIPYDPFSVIEMDLKTK